MSASKSPSNASHYMPYVVLVALVAVAVGGTRYISSRGIASPSKPSAPTKNNGEAKVKDTEPVDAFELPAKSRIGSIGAEKGLKAAIFGRRADVEKVIGDSQFGLVVDVGLPATASSSDIVSKLVSSSQATPGAVPNGHVLLVLENPKQLLKLAEELNADSSDEKGNKTQAGRLILGSNQTLTVEIGSDQGVVLEATTFAKFEPTFSQNGVQIRLKSTE